MAKALKILVVPDVRTRFERLELLIEQHQPKLTVFLGDYFGDARTSPEQNTETARWLRQSLLHEDRVHLMGDQDLQYAFPWTSTPEGFPVNNYLALRKAMSDMDWAMLDFHCWVHGILCTHAGLSAAGLPPKIQSLDELPLRDHLAAAEDDAWACLLRQQPHWLFSAAGGMVRGEWSRFQPLPKIAQLFAHHQIELPTRLGPPEVMNMCINSAFPTCGAPGRLALVDWSEIRLVSSLASADETR